MLLVDFLEREYSRRKLNLRPNSLLALHRSVSVYGAFLARPADLLDLTAEEMISFLIVRLTTVSRKTVRQDRGNLLALWRAAHAWGMHPVPAATIETIRVPRAKALAWTIEEVSRVLIACEALAGQMRHLPVSRRNWWRSLLLFLYDTGLRVNAALRCETCDVDMIRRCCRVLATHDKTWEERIVAFSPQTAHAMLPLLSLGQKVVWPWPWTRRHLWYEFKSILAVAGVSSGRYVGFHRMRKTHATQAVIVAGWEAARASLGHASLRQTEAYVDLGQLPFTRIELPRP